MRDGPDTFLVSKTQFERMWRQKKDKSAPFNSDDIRHLFYEENKNDEAGILSESEQRPPGAEPL